jgi:nucleotide-binding universal stress UspA family protein
MIPFRSILCPVDFSEHSAIALRYAVALAGISGAPLTVAWVTDPLLAQAAAVYVLDPKGEQARADLREFASEALPQNARWLAEPRLVVTVGTPDREILKIARKQHADLIVMGTHGLSGYQKVFFGSTTERVLRQTTVPVLAVPVTGKMLPLNDVKPILDLGTVIIAVDLGQDSNALADCGVRLARWLNARTLLVHVVSSRGAPARWRPAVEAQLESELRAAEQEISRLTGEPGAEMDETLVLPGRPADEIAGLAGTRHAGLIVMGLTSGARRRTARPGSIAYRILLLTPTPVLVVPPSFLHTAL